MIFLSMVLVCKNFKFNIMFELTVVYNDNCIKVFDESTSIGLCLRL